MLLVLLTPRSCCPAPSWHHSIYSSIYHAITPLCSEAKGGRGRTAFTMRTCAVV